MFSELLNINNIITTKIYELFTNPNDNNIFMQLTLLTQVRKEYIKQLKNTEDDSINKITNLFQELEIKEVNKTEEYILDKYNEIHNNIDLDNLENFYVYFQISVSYMKL